MESKVDVHGLPAKWREPKPGDECTLYTMGIRTGRRKCADELEAALRQSGEAVAIEGCGACGDGCASRADGCRLAAESPPTTSGLVEALRIARDYAAYANAEPADLALIDAVLAAHDARGVA